MTPGLKCNCPQCGATSSLCPAADDLVREVELRQRAEATLSHRIALRREIESALGITTGITSDTALAQGLAAIKTLQAELREAQDSTQRLRSALAALVGADTREELEQLEVGIRMMPAPADDRAHMLDAVHALLATLLKVGA